jgi:hypothetical protein
MVVMPQLADREAGDKVILFALLDNVEQQEILLQQLLLKEMMVEILLILVLLDVLKLAEEVVALVLLE